MLASFSLYQLLVPAFAAVMVLRVGSNYLRGQQSLRELVVWAAVWLTVSLVALFPDFSIRSFARVTGAKSGLNALIFFVLIVLSYGCLKLYVLTEHQERKLTELTRHLAIRGFFGDDADPKNHSPRQ